MSFGVNSDGNAYYKIGGADTEYPFKSNLQVYLNGAYAVKTNSDGSVSLGNSTMTLDNGDGIIGFDVTNYNYMKFGVYGRTGQEAIKTITVYIADTLGGAAIDSMSHTEGDYNNGQLHMITFDISKHSGFKFFVFHKVSSGWEPQVYSGITFLK